MFPPEAPNIGLDFRKLAMLNASGGHIRNIALNAAFLAAETGTPIGMNHLLLAARGEALKRERQFSDVEVKGWI